MKRLLCIVMAVLLTFLVGCSNENYENKNRPTNTFEESTGVLITRVEDMRNLLNNNLDNPEDPILYTNHLREEVNELESYILPSKVSRLYYNVMFLDEIKQTLEDCNNTEGLNYSCGGNSYIVIVNEDELYVERRVPDSNGFTTIEMLHINVNTNNEYSIDNYLLEVKISDHSISSTTVFHKTFDDAIDYYVLTNDQDVFLSYKYVNNDSEYDYRYLHNPSNGSVTLDYYIKEENIFASTYDYGEGPNIGYLNIYDDDRIVTEISFDQDGNIFTVAWNALYVDGWDAIRRHEDYSNRCNFVTIDGNSETIVDLQYSSGKPMYCPRQDETVWILGIDISTIDVNGLASRGFSSDLTLTQQDIENYKTLILNMYHIKLTESKDYSINEEKDIIEDLRNTYGIK